MMRRLLLSGCALIALSGVAHAQAVKEGVGCQTCVSPQVIATAGAASTPALLFNGLIFTGGSGTTTFPHLLIQPTTSTASTTWSTTGTALGVNAHTGVGNLLDLQLDGSSKLSLNAAGSLSVASTIIGSSSLTIAAASPYGWNGRGFLTSPATGSIQLGTNDAAAPVAQTLRVQNVVAGTADTAGQSWNIQGSLSTGSGVSGDIIIRTGGTGAASTVQNAQVTAMTIKGATQLVQLNAITSDAGRTDASVCEDTTTHALYAGSGTIGICLGTSSARYKHDIAPLSLGLAEIMGLSPVSYRLNADHGDPNKDLYGFTAEDMQSVLPKLVGLDAHGRANTADYVGLIPILVRAVQQQQKEIEALRAQLAASQAVSYVVLPR